MEINIIPLLFHYLHVIFTYTGCLKIPATFKGRGEKGICVVSYIIPFSPAPAPECGKLF